MIEIKKLGLAEFIDVFCEDSVFNYKQSKEILAFGKELGFKIKIHADEIVPLGGAELAASLGAISADHLLCISDQGIKDMVEKGVVATLLPGTAFCLKEKYAKARYMIDKNILKCIYWYKCHKSKLINALLIKCLFRKESFICV